MLRYPEELKSGLRVKFMYERGSEECWMPGTIVRQRYAGSATWEVADDKGEIWIAHWVHIRLPDEAS